jgi:hypothetical protein
MSDYQSNLTGSSNQQADAYWHQTQHLRYPTNLRQKALEMALARPQMCRTHNGETDIRSINDVLADAYALYAWMLIGKESAA